jgi:hypothetical protein
MLIFILLVEKLERILPKKYLDFIISLQDNYKECIFCGKVGLMSESKIFCSGASISFNNDPLYILPEYSCGSYIKIYPRYYFWSCRKIRQEEVDDEETILMFIRTRSQIPEEKCQQIDVTPIMKGKNYCKGFFIFRNVYILQKQ